MLKIITPPNSEFEQLYLKLREKEGRLYGVEEVKQLPEVKNTDGHCKEWDVRRVSLHNFLDALDDRSEISTVLEIGCGNGWFSAAIAQEYPGKLVYGCDLNMHELSLADEAFPMANLNFIYADIFEEWPADLSHFDLVILPSSVQYFSSINKLIKQLWTMTDEIQILDSPFYHEEDIEEAINRSRQYYHKLGFPQMANTYFHHSYEELAKHNPEYLYRPPTGWRRKFAKSPFPWIRLTKPRE